ncbi:hypothetical protein F5Y17DRAFT_454035 [Xylariaceae sp. FL0594]|nr:hypothetical protein F5Y17DRAFT_454035 [Xylariaceae sp. FL0594]
MRNHKHLHRKREQQHHHWEEFVHAVENVAKDLNPFTPAAALQERAPETIYKTQYTTLSATFNGPVAGFTTLGVAADPTDKPTTSGDHTTAPSAVQTSHPKPDSVNTHHDSQSLPESLAPTKSVDLDGESTLAIAGSTTTPVLPTQTAAGTTPALFPTEAVNSVSPNSASPSASASASDQGGNAGMKAGIAIGVLGGLLALGLLVFFLFNRRKKQLGKGQEHDDEKIPGEFAGGRSASIRSTTAANAPQLSLRPVTQFNPNFNERRSSKGAGVMLGGGAASPHPVNEKGGSKWERPTTSSSQNPENPFSNDAERAYSPVGTESSAPQQPTNPFNSPEHVVGVAQTTDIPASTPPPTAPAAEAGAAAAAGGSLARKASVRKEAPEPLDLTMPSGPPSPTGTEFSMHSVAPGQSPGPSKSAAAIAAAGGPPSTAVHRVQLDFKPSMDDELELQAGQLVRILHEYDDGWALCIRLDRSRQGVVPRTCLSTRPVKPRPAGGPPGPRNGGPPVNPSGQRGPRGAPRGPGPNYPPGPPHGRPESPMRPPNGRPQSPAQMRPYSPANGRPMSPHTGRPASPAGGRPMSPGPRAQSPGPRQQRPQSPSGMGPRNGAPGPSPMNPNSHGYPAQQRGLPSPPQGQVGRKPVPGQAY